MGKQSGKKKHNLSHKSQPPPASLQAAQVSFTGPIPPPALLAGYDQISPGLADRIVAMAESDLTHQQTLDQKGLNADIWERRLGQILGFMTGTFGLGVAGYVIVSGHAVSGSFLGGTVLVSLVSVFITGRKNKTGT